MGCFFCCCSQGDQKQGNRVITEWLCLAALARNNSTAAIPLITAGLSISDGAAWAMPACLKLEARMAAEDMDDIAHWLAL